MICYIPLPPVVFFGREGGGGRGGGGGGGCKSRQADARYGVVLHQPDRTIRVSPGFEKHAL